MRKKRIHLSALLLSMAMVVSVLLGTQVVYATEAAPIWVVDDADLLTDDEEQEISGLCQETYDTYSVSPIIVFVDDFGSGDIKDWQEEIFAQYSLGEGEDALMLAVSMAERDWGIVSFGKGQDIFYQDARETIGSQVKLNLKDGEYKEACETFLSVSEECIIKYENGEQIVYEEPKEPLDWYWFLAPPILGILIARRILKSWEAAMNTRIKKDSAADYLVKDSFQLQSRADLFLYKTVTKTKREKKSNDGSGGSMSSSSSGTSGKF